MKSFLDCWVDAATALFAQALAGEPQLVQVTSAPSARESFGFVATLSGVVAGSFTMLIDSGALNVPLLGEGQDQQAGWADLLREVCDSATGELLAQSGIQCRVESFLPVSETAGAALGFELRAGEQVWSVRVRDQVQAPSLAAAMPDMPNRSAEAATTSPRMDLLLDVELEATLRFGCRELPLGEVLDLGPGDVVQLDRGVADPVDLVIADKIVARGEVVLINGNFGLRVIEVAAPRKRLESVRCLF